MKNIISRLTVVSLTIVLSLSLVTPIYASLDDNRVVVTVSMPSIGWIVNDVAGDYIRIVYIVPEGGEPHIFQLTPEKLMGLADTDLFVFTGNLDFEKRIMEEYPDKEYLYLDWDSMTYGGYRIKLIKLPGESGYNSHGYWMYPDNALAIAKAVVDVLVKIDPQHEDYYRVRLELFREHITRVKREFTKIMMQYNLDEADVVISSPEIQYIITLLNTSIAGVLVSGHGSSVSGIGLSTAIDTLKQSRLPLIIVSESLEYLDLEGPVDQISSETDAKIIHIKFFSSVGDSYLALMMYNAGILSSSLSCSATVSTQVSAEIITIFLVLTLALISIVIVEALYIHRLREV